MKNLFYLIITCFLIACQEANTENKVIEQRSQEVETEIVNASHFVSKQKPKAIEKEVIDSSNYVFKQVFPITKNELRAIAKSRQQDLSTKNISASDFIWLKNKALNQSLAFYIYTDYFTPVICLFDNDNVPDSLLSRMEMHSKNGLATLSEKVQNFDKLLERNVEIDKSKFITNDNIQLGCDLSAFTNLYGEPQQVSYKNKRTIYGWHFETHPEEDGQKAVFNTNLTYDITAFFENNKLIALILHDYIP